MNDIQDIQLFTNPKFGKVRALTIDGDPWFVGKDVAEALGYSNSREGFQYGRSQGLQGVSS